MAYDRKESIFNTLKVDIISGKLPPGHLILESRLAERFGVSRTPIHEVMKRLQSEELVNVDRGGRATVVATTAQDIEEAFDILMALETMAVRTAAVKIGDSRSKDLEEIWSELDRAAALQDSALSFSAETNLLNLILDVCDNRRLRRIMRGLLGRIQRTRFISGHAPGAIELTTTELKNVINALCGGDADRAEEALRGHLTNMMALLASAQEMEEKLERTVLGVE